MNYPARATLAQCQSAYDNASDPRHECDDDEPCECSECGATFRSGTQGRNGECPECGHLEEEMIRALADDLKQQNLALKAELKCATGLIGKPMLSADIETLRKNWALLIGEDA